jgi:hypothetical protein
MNDLALFSDPAGVERQAHVIPVFKVAKRYIECVDLMQAESVKIAQEQAAASKKNAVEAEVNLKRKNDLFLFKSLFFGGTSAFMTAVYFSLSR